MTASPPLDRAHTMALERYGGYALRRGDFDPGALPPQQDGQYAGQRIAGPDNPGHVRRLQEDLHQLGFWLVGTANGIFNLATEFALREFQVYSRLGKVARQWQMNPIYAEALRQADNPLIFTGPVSGRLDDATGATLVAWLGGDFRCPVVIEARRVNAAGAYDPAVRPMHQNVWLGLEVRDTRPRMFAVDFTDRFDDSQPKDYRDANGRILLGDTQIATAIVKPGGPRTFGLRHSLASAEILPESLVGRQWSQLSPEAKSTFRVIRAVADKECLGTFDAINAYDNAVLSIGPYHHILLQESGFRNGDMVAEGELGAYLAYLQSDRPDCYHRLLEANGVGLPPYNGTKRNWNRDEQARVYRAMVRLQDTEGSYTIEPNHFELAEYFRGWHWFYRVSAALRTDLAFRTGFWFMTRLRLWDILTAEWDDEYKISPVRGENRFAMIGDIFRSETAAALLLRFHVASPGNVVRSGRAGPLLRWALSASGVNRGRDPKYWSDEDEGRLLIRLIEGFRIGYVTANGRRLNVTKPWTRQHAVDLYEWPYNEGRRYQVTSRLGPVSEGEALEPLSKSRRNGFRLDSSEWGRPPWE